MKKILITESQIIKLIESISTVGYYRAIEKNMGETVEFAPEGFYEAVDDDGNPIFKYDTFWISDKPEVAASKTIGGSVLGLYSMFVQHGKNPGIFYIYQINDKPDVDISHWDIGDFALLQEVRYRKAVQGHYIGQIKVTDDMKKIFRAYYEVVNLDAYDEPEEEFLNIFQNIDYDKYMDDIKNQLH